MCERPVTRNPMTGSVAIPILNDRGRKNRFCSRPLPPPNRACSSPAHGSPVSGSPPRGLTDQASSSCRDPLALSKEDISYLPPFALTRTVNKRSGRMGASVNRAEARTWTSPDCVALSGTRSGSICANLSFTLPPSCPPSLPRNYPDSSLLRGL